MRLKGNSLQRHAQPPHHKHTHTQLTPYSTGDGSAWDCSTTYGQHIRIPCTMINVKWGMISSEGGYVKDLNIYIYLLWLYYKFYIHNIQYKRYFYIKHTLYSFIFDTLSQNSITQVYMSIKKLRGYHLVNYVWFENMCLQGIFWVWLLTIRVRLFDTFSSLWLCPLSSVCVILLC